MRAEKVLGRVARRFREWGEMKSAGGDEGLGEIGRDWEALGLGVYHCCGRENMETVDGE